MKGPSSGSTLELQSPPNNTIKISACTYELDLADCCPPKVALNS